MPENPCPPGTSEYYVKSGDTVYRIAQNAGTTVAAIMNANPGLNPNQLYPGQRICVPGSACPGGSIYTVKPGDTFYRIAVNNGLTQAQLEAANPGVDPQRLMVGQQICIRKGPNLIIPIPPRVHIPTCILLARYSGPEAIFIPIGSVVASMVTPDTNSYSVIVSELPAPATLGNYDSYLAELNFWTPPQAPAIPYRVMLLYTAVADQLPVWAGGIGIQKFASSGDTVVIRPFNTITGEIGNGIIKGTF